MKNQINPPSVCLASRSVGPAESSVLLLALLFLAGCGGGDGVKRVPVSGYVSIDGTPLKAGAIRFVPAGDNRGPAAVATIEDGIYELPLENGPVSGKLRVEIDAINHLGFDIDDEQAYARAVEKGQAVPQNPIPESYNKRSRLQVDMPEEGKSDLDFRLSSSGEVLAAR